MTIAQKNLTPQGWRLVYPLGISDTLKRAPSESVAASGSHEPVSSRLFTAAKKHSLWGVFLVHPARLELTTRASEALVLSN